jgi:hypothetical protein
MDAVFHSKILASFVHEQRQFFCTVLQSTACYCLLRPFLSHRRVSCHRLPLLWINCACLLEQGKSKLVLIASNCPPLRKSEIEYYAMLSKTGVHHYNGNNIDLGTACGMPCGMKVFVL